MFGTSHGWGGGSPYEIVTSALTGAHPPTGGLVTGFVVWVSTVFVLSALLGLKLPLNDAAHAVRASATSKPIRSGTCACPEGHGGGGTDVTDTAWPIGSTQSFTFSLGVNVCELTRLSSISGLAVNNAGSNPLSTHFWRAATTVRLMRSGMRACVHGPPPPPPPPPPPGPASAPKRTGNTATACTPTGSPTIPPASGVNRSNSQRSVTVT